MESNFEDQRDSANILETLSTDRGRIGERITAETWWAAPAQGLGAALIVVAPAAGLAWAWLPFVLSLGFALFGLTGWVVAAAVAAGVATALIVVLYDRAYAAEVRHAS